MIWRFHIATDDGEFIAFFSASGLIRLDFPNDSSRKSPGATDDRPAPSDAYRWDDAPHVEARPYIVPPRTVVILAASAAAMR